MSEILERRFRTRDGLELVADAGGDPDRPAVILTHGWGQTRHSWRRTMGSLIARGYHVVSFDTRGHGDSQWAPDGDYRMTMLASDIAEVRRTLGPRAAVVGASMGGLSGLIAVDREMPGFLDGLVMIDIVLRPASAGVARLVGFMKRHGAGFASLDEAADAVAAYSGQPRAASSTGLARNLRLREDGRYYWHWDPRWTEMGAERDAEMPDPAELCAPGLDATPMLLVRGGASDITDSEGVAQMRQIIPHLELHEIPRAGHMVAGDRNDTFNAGIFAFLERVLPPR